jgi:hypothetical protein
MNMHFLNRLFRPPDDFLKRSVGHCLLVFWLSFGVPIVQPVAMADDMLEYQVKAAFIYNFIVFTQWPDNTSETIQLCVYGEDYFKHELDKLHNRSVGKRHIRVVRVQSAEKLTQCQVIFFSKSVSNNLSSTLIDLQDKSILTLADSPNAISQGIVINMSVLNEKIVFEINLAAARKSGLDISSKLLQLAVKVHQ